MDLVDRQGSIDPLAGRSLRLPIAVRPVVRVGAGDDRGCPRRGLRGACHRVRFLRQHVSVRPDDLVFVAGTRAGAGHEQFPDAGLSAQTHGMTTPVPAVEVAHHRDTPRIRCPNGEAHTGHALDRHRDGPEAAAQFVMRAFANEVEIEVAEQEAETVGAFGVLDAARPADPEPVGTGRLQETGEQPGGMDHLQRAEAAAVFACHDVDAECAGQEGPDGAPPGDRVVAEDREGIAVLPLHQRMNGFGRNSRHRVPNQHHGRPSLPVKRSTIALKPRNGIGSHFGRFATS